jgi:hypothetical protein
MTPVTTSLLRTMADDDSGSSLSSRLRARRFELFERLTSRLPRPLRVIDLGGTTGFWEQRGWAGRDDVFITLVNLAAEERRHANVLPTSGDATNLADHADKSYDIAFSNSVIEHLFTLENQRAMAAEVRRVAHAYWVQTPNYWFPMEPHFLVPGWQWLPEPTRVAIVRRRPVGWMGRCPDPEVARRIVSEVRLLRRRELASLFPEASIVGERFGGMVKSWTAIAGFPAGSARPAEAR